MGDVDETFIFLLFIVTSPASVGDSMALVPIILPGILSYKRPLSLYYDTYNA